VPEAVQAYMARVAAATSPAFDGAHEKLRLAVSRAGQAQARL
jgi:hypothetical protein